MRTLGAVPPGVTGADATDMVLVGAALVACAKPVEKPAVTITAAVISAAFRASCLMCMVSPG
jgi:hypothetical protein